jgi:hypothetical protein
LFRKNWRQVTQQPLKLQAIWLMTPVLWYSQGSTWQKSILRSLI